MSWNRLIEGTPDRNTSKKAASKEDSLQFSDNKHELARPLFEDSLNHLNGMLNTPLKSSNQSHSKDEVLISYSQLLEVLDLISQANHSTVCLTQR